MPRTTKTKSVVAAKKKKAEPTAQLHFLDGMLKSLVNQRNSYDLRTEVLMAVSAGVFILCLQSIFSEATHGIIGFIVIAIAALFSCILCIFALRPPEILVKRDKLLPSIIHHGRIYDMTGDEFQKEMKSVLENHNQIIDEYSKMIYNLAVFTTIRKKYFINQAGHTLIIGLVIGFILVFLLP